MFIDPTNWSHHISSLAWLFHMYDTTNSCVQHDSFMWYLSGNHGVLSSNSPTGVRVRACACVCMCVRVCACMCVLLLNLPTHAHAHALPTLKWLIHSCVWHDPFIHMCDVTYACDLVTVLYPKWIIHSCVWHDSFMCVTWLIHVCDMTHSFIRMTRLIHSYVWHDSFTHIHLCFDHTILPETTHWFICVTCLTRPYVWHDSFTYIQLCCDYIILPEMPPDIFNHSLVELKMDAFIDTFGMTHSHIYTYVLITLSSPWCPQMSSVIALLKKKLIRLWICMTWLIHTYTPVFWLHYPLHDVPTCLQS